MAIIQADESGFSAAVRSLHGGDTLELHGPFTSLLRIVNLDFRGQPRVTFDADNARVHGTYNGNIYGVRFTGKGWGPNTLKASAHLEVRNGGDIVFEWLDLVGNQADINSAGIRLSNVADITIDDCHLSDIGFGISVLKCTNLASRRNTFRQMLCDAHQIEDYHGLLIEKCDLRGGKAFPGAHPDFIQLRPSSTGPCNDAILRDNYAEGYTQGIFAQLNTVGPVLPIAHVNMLIERNVFYTSAPHGITVYAGDGITARDNHVYTPADAQFPTLISFLANCRNVVQTGNVVHPRGEMPNPPVPDPLAGGVPAPPPPPPPVPDPTPEPGPVPPPPPIQVPVSTEAAVFDRIAKNLMALADDFMQLAELKGTQNG